MATGDLISQVVIETRFLPPIVIDHPLDSTPGAPNPLLSILKPKITIATPWHDPFVSHPWGEPGANHWPLVRDVALIALLVVVGAVGWRMLK